MTAVVPYLAYARKDRQTAKRKKAGKFARVANAKWKLRRSQWILN